jgi:hypothetical protein
MMKGKLAAATLMFAITAAPAGALTIYGTAASYVAAQPTN